MLCAVLCQKDFASGQEGILEEVNHAAWLNSWRLLEAAGGHLGTQAEARYFETTTGVGHQKPDYTVAKKASTRGWAMVET